MCELYLDSREGGAYKRTKAPRFGPRGGGEGGRERNRRVYGSQNQHMHAPLLSAQVTSSSSYLSFFSMQQHPTQPTIEAIHNCYNCAKGSLYICIPLYLLKLSHR